MDFDALVLSRIQFGFTIAFHVTFASISIGLAGFLVLLEGLWLRRADDTYQRLYIHWAKVFALVVVFGVISGVVLSYQFGTNWSGFVQATANVLGPLFGYEVLTAFFLQASFLGIMLFGWRLVGPALHFIATCMVAAGTIMSAFWVLAANSWMQSPAGYELRDGVFHATDWIAVIFNPTMPFRFVHTILAAYAATAFILAGVSAYQVLKSRAAKDAAVLLRIALIAAAVLVPVQFIAGHEHGLSVARTQPAKHAAITGHWNSHDTAAPLVLFAWPDQERQTNTSEVTIPEIGSLLATGTWNGPITGLLEWPKQDQPNVAVVFWAFRVMVASGLVMLAVALLCVWPAWRGTLARRRVVLWLLVAMIPAGIVAMLAGWITAEAGRQPFSVYGLLRTSQSVSPVGTRDVIFSLTLFAVTYVTLFGAGLGYLARLATRGASGTPASQSAAATRKKPRKQKPQKTPKTKRASLTSRLLPRRRGQSGEKADAKSGKKPGKSKPEAAVPPDAAPPPAPKPARRTRKKGGTLASRILSRRGQSTPDKAPPPPAEEPRSAPREPELPELERPGTDEILPEQAAPEQTLPDLAVHTPVAESTEPDPPPADAEEAEAPDTDGEPPEAPRFRPYGPPGTSRSTEEDDNGNS